MKAVELAGLSPKSVSRHSGSPMTAANWRITILLKGEGHLMSISIHPELETKLRARAAAEGLTVEAYLERLVRAEQSAEDELTALALQGVDSGNPIEVGPGYWEAKHRKLDERLRGTSGR
jgi:plasmid stability protein